MNHTDLAQRSDPKIELYIRNVLYFTANLCNFHVYNNYMSQDDCRAYLSFTEAMRNQPFLHWGDYL